jgi:hypothetical protein
MALASSKVLAQSVARKVQVPSCCARPPRCVASTLGAGRFRAQRFIPLVFAAAAFGALLVMPGDAAATESPQGMTLPATVSSLATESNADTLTPSAREAPPPVPNAALRALTRTRIEQRAYTTKESAAANSPFFAGKGDEEHHFLVLDVLRFRDLYLFRSAVVIRLTIDTVVRDARANITSIPWLAASGTYGYSSSIARLEIMGASSPQFAKVLPTSEEFSTANIAKWMIAVDKIRALLEEPDTYIDPIWMNYPPSGCAEDSWMNDAVAATYTIGTLARGETLTDALKDAPKAATTQAIERIRAIYQTLVGVSPDAPVPLDVRQRARASFCQWISLGGVAGGEDGPTSK